MRGDQHISRSVPLFGVIVRVTLRLTVSQSVCLGVEIILWTFDQILLPFQESGSGICCPVSVGRPLWREAGSVLCPLSESLYGWQSVSMSWRRADFVDVWPDIASFSRVWVWNLLSCLCGAPSPTRGRVCPLSESESHSLYGWQSGSQYVWVTSPLCGRLTRYCFLFKSLGLEFVVLSLWGALSDERSVSQSQSHFTADSQSVCLGVEPTLWTFDQILLPF
jgi:hypothetical protein